MLQMQMFSRDADVLKAVWQDGGNCDGQFYVFFCWKYRPVQLQAKTDLERNM